MHHFLPIRIAAEWHHSGIHRCLSHCWTFLMLRKCFLELNIELPGSLSMWPLPDTFSLPPQGQTTIQHIRRADAIKHVAKCQCTASPLIATLFIALVVFWELLAVLLRHILHKAKMKLERSCNHSIIQLSHSSLNHKSVCWWPFNPSLALHLLGSDTSVKWSPVYQSPEGHLSSKNSAENHNPLHPRAYCACPAVPRWVLGYARSSLLLSLSECWTWQHLFLCFPHYALELHWWLAPFRYSYTGVC